MIQILVRLVDEVLGFFAFLNFLTIPFRFLWWLCVRLPRQRAEIRRLKLAVDRSKRR